MKKTEDSKMGASLKGIIERFCTANERKARISLILAAAVAVGTLGSVTTAAILSKPDEETTYNSVDLNTAEAFLAQASMNAMEHGDEIDPTTSETSETAPSETKPKKRGGLTGEHVIDYGDLKSLSDDELVDAILSGKAGLIDTSKIEKGAEEKTSHHGAAHDGGGGSENMKQDTTPAPVAPPQNQDSGSSTTDPALPAPAPKLDPITMFTYELGVDVSAFNGSINWSKAKADGIKFAFIRCGGRGYGSAGRIYDDSMFYTNIKNAKAAGVKVGVYFFSQAITPYEALEEASVVLDKLGGMGLDLPVVMDWETEYDGEHRTENLSGEMLSKCIQAFCSTISQHGYTPMVYLDTGNINRLGSHFGECFPKYKLWYAYPYAVYSDGSQYKAGDTVPPRSYAFEYWQYSWKGKVAGISSNYDPVVDLDIHILGSTTLYGPEIKVSNQSITSTVGDSVNLMSGVQAISSQKSDATSRVTYEIKNSSNNTVTVDQAKQTVGKYVITYTYVDDFRGTVYGYALWTVTAAPTATPEPTATPTPEPTLTPTAAPGGETTPPPTPEEPTPTPVPEEPEPTPEPTEPPVEPENPPEQPEPAGEGTT